MSEEIKKSRTWISFRVKPAEYDRIQRLLAETTCQKLSEYARLVLLQKPVTVKYRNQSADDFLEEMIQLKKQLQAIGNNYNQAVKRLHSIGNIPEIKAWVLEHQEIHRSFVALTQIILSRLDQIHKLWLSV